MTDEELITSIQTSMNNAHMDVIASADGTISRLGMLYLRLNAAIRRARKQNPAKPDVFYDDFDDIGFIMDEIESWLLTWQENFKPSASIATAEENCVALMQALCNQLSGVTATAASAHEKAAVAQESADRLAQVKRTLENKLARLREHSLADPRTRNAVWGLTGGHCYYCDAALIVGPKQVEFDDYKNIMHIDHLVPKSLGGPDHIANYVPSCAPCNITKGNKTYVEFIRDRHPRLRLVVSK